MRWIVVPVSVAIVWGFVSYSAAVVNPWLGAVAASMGGPVGFGAVLWWNSR